jgi:hypothetical protein
MIPVIKTVHGVKSDEQNYSNSALVQVDEK